MSEIGNVIAFVGMAGSGKSSASDQVCAKGWARVTFGDLTRRELDKVGLPHTQPNEREVRERLRREHGPAAYAKLSIDEIRRAMASGPVVIDGLYSWAEYKLLVEALASFVVVCVFADRAVRYRRLAERPVRPLTPAQAFERDVTELETLDKGGPIAMADYVIINNDDEDDLRGKVDRLLVELYGAEAAS